jgi:hypothetical protein
VKKGVQQLKWSSGTSPESPKLTYVTEKSPSVDIFYFLFARKLRNAIPHPTVHWEDTY